MSPFTPSPASYIIPPTNDCLFQQNNSHATIYSLEEWFSEPLSLCHVGWQICPPKYTVGPAIRDLYLIHYVRSGCGYLKADNTTYTIRQGESFLIFPDEITTYFADALDPWNYVFFALRGELSLNVLKQAGFDREHRILSVHDNRIPETILSAVGDLFDCHSPHLYGLSILMKLLSFYAEQQCRVPGISSKQKYYATRTKDYIDYHFSTKVSLESVASSLAICRNHLYRTFKAEFGVSPNTYLTNKRLEFASNLLRNSDLPTERISELSGFPAYSAFYRLFKLHFNCSPNEYRRTHATPNNLT